jgi:hypothetical protein
MENITLENNQVVVKNTTDLEVYVTRERQQLNALKEQIDFLVRQLNAKIENLGKLIK